MRPSYSERFWENLNGRRDRLGRNLKILARQEESGNIFFEIPCVSFFKWLNADNAPSTRIKIKQNLVVEHSISSIRASPSRRKDSGFWTRKITSGLGGSWKPTSLTSSATRFNHVDDHLNR
jgi:hypothetical protein